MSEPSGTDARLDRIEALTAKVKLMDDLDAINGEKIEALTAELNTCRMAQVVMDNTVAELEAKLAKAVEALEIIRDRQYYRMGPGITAQVIARAALADIKGESHD
jgi:hypothetical protein